MIDFTKTYPTPDQFESIDLFKESEKIYSRLIDSFNNSANSSVSKEAFILSQLAYLESKRDNINTAVIKDNYGIDLFPFFKFGWDIAINGIYDVPNNLYKFYPEIKEQLVLIFSKKKPPINYFETLSRLSIEMATDGMAEAGYYYWIKDLQVSKGKKYTPPIGYEDIFVTLEKWNVFIKLVDIIVNRRPKEHNYANFSVIFQTLIDKNIIPKQRHKIYLDYCDVNHNTDFSGKTKLKSNTSNHSTELITTYLDAANLLRK